MGDNMYKSLSLFLFAIIFCPYLAYATPDASVTSTSGAPGSTVSVSVLADFDKAVNSIQFTLQFNAQLLTVSGVKAGGSNSSWVVVNNPKVAGQVVVGMFNPTGPTASIKGSQQQIAFISFTVNKGSSLNKSVLTLSKMSFDATSVTKLSVGTFSIGGQAEKPGVGLKLKKL
jgi:hypothetical protein